MNCLMFHNALTIVHDILKENVNEGDIVVDATAGNGQDTLFLCQTVGENGKVYAFDIQEDALAKTRMLLEQNNIGDRCIYIHNGHENIKAFVSGTPKAIVFNLGYLPGKNKKITTMVKTTLEAVQNSLDILSIGGIVTITVYPGHDEGKEEEMALETYIKKLPQKQFNVVKFSFPNRRNNSPYPIIIQKIGQVII